MARNSDETSPGAGAGRPGEAQPTTAVQDFAASIGSRNLMIIIVTMPLVFVVIIAAIFMLFGAQEPAPAAGAAAPAPAPEAARAGDPAPGAPEPILIPEGAAAGALALDGDRLAVRVDGPDGAMIVIYDLKAGAVAARVPIRTAAGAR